MLTSIFCSSCKKKINSIISHKKHNILCEKAKQLILKCDKDYYRLRNKRREYISKSYETKKVELEGDNIHDLNYEYVYKNQIEDANKIFKKFYENDLNAVGVRKRVKIGATGLIISIFKLFGEHNHDYFGVNPNMMLLITGYNNKEWEDDMKKQLPCFMTNNIFHHGQLKKIKKRLQTIRNGLIIIDELDVGNKEESILHKLLYDSGLWNIQQIRERNIRFVLISASGLSEFKLFEDWGSLYYQKIFMTVPNHYTGIEYFLDKGLYKDNYQIKEKMDVVRWIVEDILPYGNDYRIHEIRVNTKNKNIISIIKKCCNDMNIDCVLHTSKQFQDYSKLVKHVETHKKHMIVILKELHYRATLYPLRVKKKIGARMGRYSQSPSMDTTAQNQRMCGYGLKSLIEQGYKFGPFRENIDMISEYIQWSKGTSDCKHTGREKRNLMYNPSCLSIKVNDKTLSNIHHYYKQFDSYQEAKQSIRNHNGKPRDRPMINGFYHSSCSKRLGILNKTKILRYLDEIKLGKRRKTSNIPIPKKRGQVKTRLYIVYEPNDPNNNNEMLKESEAKQGATFIVRYIKRV